MIDISLLLISVLTLFLYMLAGFALKSLGIAGEGFCGSLSAYVINIAQGAMFIHGFLTELDMSVLKGMLAVCLLAFVAHLIFYAAARGLYVSAPDGLRRVLRFASVFSNAGFMGIPVISQVFGERYVIYASIYVVWFNVFAFSVGRMIYTDDKSYISPKKMLLNPAVIPILVGLVLYLTGVGGLVERTVGGEGAAAAAVTLVYDALSVLKGTVAPLSMAVVGARLADISLSTCFKDKYLYRFLAVRHLAFPVLMWGLMRALQAAGIIGADITAVLLILCSTPAAAFTTMFAELYGGEAAYSGKLVAVSTLCSVVTMPLVALLLKI